MPLVSTSTVTGFLVEFELSECGTMKLFSSLALWQRRTVMRRADWLTTGLKTTAASPTPLTCQHGKVCDVCHDGCPRLRPQKSKKAPEPNSWQLPGGESVILYNNFRCIWTCYQVVLVESEGHIECQIHVSYFSVNKMSMTQTPFYLF